MSKEGEESRKRTGQMFIEGGGGEWLILYSDCIGRMSALSCEPPSPEGQNESEIERWKGVRARMCMRVFVGIVALGIVQDVSQLRKKVKDK